MDDAVAVWQTKHAHVQGRMHATEQDVIRLQTELSDVQGRLWRLQLAHDTKMQHWETTFALEKQKHASALSMQKEELLQSCVEMVTREMEAYKRQVTADMIAMSQAASDELETRSKQYEQRIDKLEERLQQYELLIAQHNELRETVPKLEADVRAHKVQIDLAQHTGDFVTKTVDHLVATNEEEHEMLATQIQEMDVKVQSMAENQMSAATFPEPAAETLSLGERK